MNRFHTKTNWCVITGAPSSGKTSVINELAKRGYMIQSEIAREIIEAGLSRGRTLEDIRKDALDFQEDILETAMSREAGLDPAELIFLDRGLPDSITYLKLAGFDGVEAEADSYVFQYRAVFIFDRLPVVKDNVRTESEVLADRIDEMLEADYRRVGYKPVRVPVMSIEQRTDFVLEYLDSVKTIPVA